MDTEVRKNLEEWSSESCEAFEANHRNKSFSEYLEDIHRRPYSLSRNAPQYVLDMMEHFGVRQVASMGEMVGRFRLFDADFGRPTDQPLMGQEIPVLELYDALKNLVLEGRPDRILHLHGPNGSSKSLIVDLLMRGCEEYSRTRGGALFTLHWVFPREEARTMGFGSNGPEAGSETEMDSYAHLTGESIECRIACDLHDSPLLLIPPDRRRRWLGELLASAPDEERNRFIDTHYLMEGEPCPRCREIYDTLLNEYRGSVEEVLRHVQVRRLYLSRRYRRGAVVISPQGTPDAGTRQLTYDAHLSRLPPSLQHLGITQLYGDLVDANNGIVEFSDFLTRASELNKYLLAATERGEVSLTSANIYLNSLLFATSNERHLDSFKESQDFASFKGRMILIAVPYLLEISKECEVYDPILARIGRIKHVVPHLKEMAALWAVLTRLNRPAPESYPEEVRELVEKITLLEKAFLYDDRALPPGGFRPPQEVRLLRENLPQIREEFRDTPIYEGRFGASPRETREIFYNAVSRRRGGCFSPPLLFEELDAFIKDRSMYLFLQIKPDSGYHDAEAAIYAVRKVYRAVLSREILAAMGLAPEGEYVEVFDRYLDHVSADLDGKKSQDAATGMHPPPGAVLMGQVEEVLGVSGDLTSHRKDLLARAASHKEDHPDEPLDISGVFAEEIERLVQGFQERAEERIQEVGRDLLLRGTPAFDALPDERRRAAESLLDNLVKRFGYCPHCAPEVVDFFMQPEPPPPVPPPDDEEDTEEDAKA